MPRPNALPVDRVPRPRVLRVELAALEMLLGPKSPFALLELVRRRVRVHGPAYVWELLDAAVPATRVRTFARSVITAGAAAS